MVRLPRPEANQESFIAGRTVRRDSARIGSAPPYLVLPGGSPESPDPRVASAAGAGASQPAPARAWSRQAHGPSLPILDKIQTSHGTAAPRPVPHQFVPAALAEQVWRDAAALAPGSLLAVSSADGGVGRSTLVAALGSLLTLAVPGPVIAVDANPRPWGGLGERVGAGSGSVWDSFRELPRLRSRAEVER